MAASRLVVVSLLIVVLVGCTAEQTVDSDRLPDLVLQPVDVGNGFTRFDEGPQARTDGLFAGAQPAGSGREGAWKARYTANVATAGSPAQVLESRAEVFSSSDDASHALADLERAIRGQARTQPGSAKVLDDELDAADDAVELGESAIGLTTLQPGVDRSIRSYTLAWRRRNVTAAVVVNGFDGALRLEDAVELAYRQDHRIQAALSD